MMVSVYGALGLAALLFLWLPSKRLALRARSVLAVLLLALTQLPIDGVSLAGHWQATVGELAITTTLLLLTLAWRRWRGQRPLLPGGVRGPLVALGIFALAFYPLSMGAARLDPYRLGYEPTVLLAAVLLLTIWAWWRARHALTLALLAATLAYAGDCLHSHNYWDYLFDPLLALFGLNLAIRQGWRWWRRRAQPDQAKKTAA